MEDPLLLPVVALMEDRDNMEDLDYDYDLEPEDIAPYTPVPFRRKQHILNFTYKVHENIMGKADLAIRFTNNHQRLCRSIEGDVTIIEDKTFPLPYLAGIYSGLLLRKYDADSLYSPIERHAIIRMILLLMNFSSLDDDEFSKLETHFSLFLLNAMSNSSKEGYNAIDASVDIEFATVDTYDEEEVAWAFDLPIPASRASIAALPSQVSNDEDNDEVFSNRCSICLDEYFACLDEYSSGITVTQLPCLHDFHRGCVNDEANDEAFSNRCSICLDEYSACLDEYSSGITVTQLPCLHDFHRGCVERWLNMSNSCPTCRLPI